MASQTPPLDPLVPAYRIQILDEEKKQFIIQDGNRKGDDFSLRFFMDMNEVLEKLIIVFYVQLGPAFEFLENVFVVDQDCRCVYPVNTVDSAVVGDPFDRLLVLILEKIDQEEDFHK